MQPIKTSHTLFSFICIFSNQYLLNIFCKTILYFLAWECQLKRIYTNHLPYIHNDQTILLGKPNKAIRFCRYKNVQTEIRLFGHTYKNRECIYNLRNWQNKYCILLIEHSVKPFAQTFWQRMHNSWEISLIRISVKDK